jgi:hypothetical protein
VSNAYVADVASVAVVVATPTAHSAAAARLTQRVAELKGQPVARGGTG